MITMFPGRRDEVEVEVDPSVLPAQQSFPAQIGNKSLWIYKYYLRGGKQSKTIWYEY